MRSEHYSRLPEPIILDRESAEPLHAQITRYFREWIKSGQLGTGPLPSSRALARELGCSRNTVVLAYDQLAAEGFLASRSRSATTILPVADLTHEILEGRASSVSPERPAVSKVAKLLEDMSKPDLERFTSLSPVPNFSIFPFNIWTRLYKEIWQDPEREMLLDREPMGYAPLREALADHLRVSRGLSCSAANIVITSGTTQSLSLVLRCLADPGDTAWVENPCFAEAISLMRLSDVETCPVNVDEHGISVREGIARAPDARICLVAPANQFPLGMTMSLERRLELLDWAGRSGAWIIEDDYDSELIWSTRSIPALQSLAADHRVIYLGTFSKSVFPNLRMGYLVADEETAAIVARAKVFLNGPTSMQLQPVLAAFIREGHFARHLSRAARIYGRQRANAIALVERHLGELVRLIPNQRGIHLAVELAGAAAQLGDAAVVAAAAQRGMTLRRLSQFYLEEPAKQGMVFGFAGARGDEFERGMAELAGVIRSLVP